MVISDYIVNNDIDIFVITESWLYSKDRALVGQLTPEGYGIIHLPRDDRPGGGVAIIHKLSMHLTDIDQGFLPSMEYIASTVKCLNASFRLLSIYRPTPSSRVKRPISVFFQNFEDLLEKNNLISQQLLIVGDFNIHVDIPSDHNAKGLNSIINSWGLTQHVQVPTHVNEHTLDLIISRSAKFLTDIHTDQFLSDHCSILCKLQIDRPASELKQVTYRKYMHIDIESFKADLHHSLMGHDLGKLDINASTSLYNSTISDIVDKHAPQQHRQIRVRTRPLGLSPEIVLEKRKRRKLEKVWRSTKTSNDRRKFTEQKVKVNSMLENADKKYYSDMVVNNASNPKRLFRIMSGLLNKNPVARLPPHDNAKALADHFGGYFHDKVAAIRNGLQSGRINTNSTPEVPSFKNTMEEFSEISTDKIQSMLKRVPSKTCELDPIPTWVLKLCEEVPIKLLTHIVNTSLSSSTMPVVFKEAILSPLLKKEGLALLDNNFRPISNLAFVSKLIERCVAEQTSAHMTSNGLHEVLQSAYKMGHSTETALLRVHNDICMAMDNQQVTILVLLDLSAAFDTVDHAVLLKRLSERVGIRGMALKWFQSYLSGRTQRVSVKDALSEPSTLSCGVPQGSVLGPLLFTVYTLPLGDLVRRHGLDFHLFADDSQLYIVFRPLPIETVGALETTSSCVSNIDEWMVENSLKFNGGKTDMTIIGTRQSLSKLPNDLSLHISGVKIIPKHEVKNLGVIFDHNLNFRQHITNVCKSAYFHLHNIRCIRKYLNDEAASTAIQAFVTSRLDYANSLLYGLPKSQISRLQRVQNSAARLLTGAAYRDHITPVLERLHWLPISRRIQYKILTLTYKIINGSAPAYLCDLVQIHRAS